MSYLLIYKVFHAVKVVLMSTKSMWKSKFHLLWMLSYKDHACAHVELQGSLMHAFADVLASLKNI